MRYEVIIIISQEIKLKNLHRTKTTAVIQIMSLTMNPKTLWQNFFKTTEIKSLRPKTTSFKCSTELVTQEFHSPFPKSSSDKL